MLIDFGIVKEVLRFDADGNPTSSIIAGTPGYISLEQAAGRPVFSSDLYSLGATAIFLLTGKNPQQMTDFSTGDIAWRKYTSDVSSKFAVILDKTIESSLEDRYRTANDIKNILDSISPRLNVPNLFEKPKSRLNFVNEVNDIDFQVNVLNSNLPVLVDFWAEWCGPCRMIAPAIETLAEHFSGNALFYKMNVDNNTKVPSDFGVRGIPTLILFKNGIEQERMVGAVSREAIAQIVVKHI